MFSDPNQPMVGGSWERIVVQQSKISACPPNQIMDLLILVDTTSDFSENVVYKPRTTLNIIKYLINSYHISPWDTHIGIGSWNGYDAVFYRTHPSFAPQIWEYVIFRSGNLYSLCSPGNQHYQGIIYFFNFSSKKVEIGDQISIIKNISLIISRCINYYN